MNRRETQLAHLAGKSFDVLVIGGGIVGAGIARDAAMRGFRVALVEKGDVASGTSSKTSKLIHGGLRYLEHGRLRLVFESLRERATLRTIAPDFVWVLPLMLPVYRGDTRPAWKIAIGLALYDLLAGTGSVQARRMLSPAETIRLEPTLSAEGLRAAALYGDCQMDDARLCLANVLQAMSFGAVCANYVKVVALHKRGGRVGAVTAEDVRTGRIVEIEAKVVVNAAGPWGDAVRRLSDRQADTRISPTKGSHVLIPRISNQALFFEATHDRRMLFLLPWGSCSLIGTTESAHGHSLDELRAEASEVDYLLSEVNRLLSARMRAEDVIATFAGARPLLAYTGSATRASREHRIDIDRSGLVSVMGGKYTTYRLMAKQTMDLIIAHEHLRPERCLTDQVSLLEPVYDVALDRWQGVTRRLAPELVARLTARYGTGAFRIFELLEFEPGLVQPVCSHHAVILAELVYSLQEELACTITDLLARRTQIAWSPCHGREALPMLSDLLHRYHRLSIEEISQEVAAYEEFLAHSLAFRLHGASSKGGRIWPEVGAVVSALS